MTVNTRLQTERYRFRLNVFISLVNVVHAVKEEDVVGRG